MIKVSFGRPGPHGKPLEQMTREELTELAGAVLTEVNRRADPRRTRRRQQEHQLSLFAVNLASRRDRLPRFNLGGGAFTPRTLSLDEWYADIERRRENAG